MFTAEARHTRFPTFTNFASSAADHFVAVRYHNGQWEYDETGGGSWVSLSGVSDTSALLLPPQADIRYVPDGQNGEVAVLTFRAWDGSVGTAGEKANATDHGGQTAFSSETDTLTFNQGRIVFRRDPGSGCPGPRRCPR